MRLQYFGDAFDLVKQCLLVALSELGPWLAEPMLTESVSAGEARQLAGLLGVPLLSTRVLEAGGDRETFFEPARACVGHLFLDPDKGIWRDGRLANADRPRYVLMDEVEKIVKARPESLTLVFDQSLQRGRERAGVVKKLAALGEGVHAWAYVSQACFILAGCCQGQVERAATAVLRKTRIPESRLIYGPSLLERRMDPAVEGIVQCLAEKMTRATYKAVGEALNVPARSVGGLLGPRRPLASWVVNGKTKEPTGYREDEKDTNLHRKPTILTTGDEVRQLVKECGQPSNGSCAEE